LTSALGSACAREDPAPGSAMPAAPALRNRVVACPRPPIRPPDGEYPYIFLFEET
jgi:hypothetical protein